MAHSFNISTIIKAIVKLQLNISLLFILYINFKLIYKCPIKLGVGNNIIYSYIVTCYHGTSVVRSLKFFAFPHPLS